MTEAFTGEMIHLPEFARERQPDPYTWIIEDVLFEECTLLGPAVLVTGDSAAFLVDNPEFPGLPDSREVLWRLVPDQQIVIGAITVTGCAFSRCSFVGVGFAAGPETIEELFRLLG